MVIYLLSIINIFPDSFFPTTVALHVQIYKTLIIMFHFCDCVDYVREIKPTKTKTNFSTLMPGNVYQAESHRMVKHPYKPASIPCGVIQAPSENITLSSIITSK